MTQTIHTFSRRIARRLALDYLLHLPPAYPQRKSYPLILFLHGSGERGSDVNVIRQHGIPKIVEQQPEFPFIALSPQCPCDSTWFMQRDALLMLLDFVMTKHAVDVKGCISPASAWAATAHGIWAASILSTLRPLCQSAAAMTTCLDILSASPACAIRRCGHFMARKTGKCL